MKKQILGSILGLGLLLFLAPKAAQANEGVANLRGSGTSGACFVASIFIDGNYKVMATCRDLKIALSPELNRYILWVEDSSGKQRRMGEIIAGKYSGQTDMPFSKLFVTVERDSYVNKPSTNVMLSGNIESIDFGPGVSPAAAIITPTPTPTRAETVQTTEQNNDVTPSSNGLASAFSTILKVVLLGFGALIIVVGITSFMSRRRSL